MKKLVLLALTLVAFNANAGFDIAQSVEIPKLSCQKDKDKSFYNGVGGAAYLVDWRHDFCENVSAWFGKANDVVRWPNGSVKGTTSIGKIRILKPIRFKVLSNGEWKDVAIQPGRYTSSVDGAVRNRNGDNYIDIKSRKFSMRLFFRGRVENAVMGYLKVSFLVNGYLKHYLIDCNTATIAKAMARHSILKRK